MRLINRAYADPQVLRHADDVVRHAAVLHGPPGAEPELERRKAAQRAIDLLRALLETLPAPAPLRMRRYRSSA